MAIGNVELKRECFLKHLHTGTARIKQDKETEEEDKKRRENMERCTAARKKILAT